DVVFDDAFLSKDLCIPVREPRLCSKDTDVEAVDDRTALLLQRCAQHALELFRCLLRLVRSRIVLDRFHVSPSLPSPAHFARFPRARAHPGGNLAGSSRLERAIAGKWLLAPRRGSAIRIDVRFRWQSGRAGGHLLQHSAKKRIFVMAITSRAQRRR